MTGGPCFRKDTNNIGNNNDKDIPGTVQTTNGNTVGDSITAAGVPTRFDLNTNVRGQMVVSDITSLAEEQARSCLLMRCITKGVFL